jgi:BirA family transcriptional regulator, biotin operon repressor / biotin---[acetyl-CoA-carboxylase] ligase
MSTRTSRAKTQRTPRTEEPARVSDFAVSPLDIRKIDDGLVTKRLGRRIHYFPRLDSTNSHARRLAEQGSRDGEMVIAECQTEGRGRLGRVWVSPPHLNLYLSFILRPRLPPVCAPQITLMAAVALSDTIASFTAATPAIKWPNDILLGGKKVAGILSESSSTSERIEFVILGIGININYPVELMPEAIRNHATSLLAVNGKTTSREAFANRLIQDLDRCYGEIEESGFSAIAPRWEARFGLKGKKVKVEVSDQILIGMAAGIDRDGALIVIDERGKSHRVVAGDVIPL